MDNKCEYVFTDREAWLKWRIGKYGASQAASACNMGIFPPKNQDEMLEWELTGKKAFVSPSMQLGLDREKAILDMAEEVYGYIIDRGICFFDEKSNLAASLDGWVSKERLLIEVKVSDKPPMELLEVYKWQLQQQMLLSGTDRCMLLIAPKSGEQIQIKSFIEVKKDIALQQYLVDMWAAYHERLLSADRTSFLTRHYSDDYNLIILGEQYAALKKDFDLKAKELDSIKERMLSFLPCDTVKIENDFVAISITATSAASKSDLQKWYEMTRVGMVIEGELAELEKRICQPATTKKIVIRVKK